ncbi:MAG: TonB-dependent receptor, partial [Sandaracinobacteroides sp.]
MRACLLASVALLMPQQGLAQSESTTSASLGPQSGAIALLPQARLELRGDPARLLPEPLVPNFAAPLVAGVGHGGAHAIRGLGAATPLPPADPSIGAFVDGISLAGRDGTDFALFPLDSVEVRRGGQGASLGRNTAGGAVLLSLVQPADKFGGEIAGQIGSYDQKMLRGSVDVPVGAIAFKLSGYYQDDDGFARNTLTGERLNDRDRAGLRFAARLDPLEQLSWTVALAYTEAEAENLLAFDCDPLGGEGCGGRYLTTGLQKARRLGGGPHYSLPIAGSKADFRLGGTVSTTLISSHLSWGGEAATLSLVTGFLDIGERSAVDYADGRGLAALGASPVRGFVNGGLAVLTDGSDRQFSQEVKLSGLLAGGRLHYAVGGLLLDRSRRIDSADLFTAETGTPTGAPGTVADRISETETSSVAVFADASFALSDRFTIGAGLRYTDETQDFAIRDSGACGAAGCLGGLVGNSVPGSQGLKIWTPRASASFRVSREVTLFADASRGYRPGGWNSSASTPDALAAFGAETAWTYQAGIASSWFGGRLDARLTGFAIDADGYQGSGAAILGGIPQLWTGTLGDWRNRGVELELGLKPLDGLLLTANLGLQDARYRPTDAILSQQSQCLADLSGDACGRGIVTADGAIAEPMRTPDVSAGFGGSFSVAVPTAGILLTPTVDVSYAGRRQTDIANTAPAQGAHWLLDAGIAIETDDSFWILSFACRNCLDETVVEQSLLGGAYLSQPRTL